ncbi:unnamed protein product [Ectocarpus fasciculatus]
MPSFGQMTLQELAGMMAVYGLKKKSKREMTERLEHIWKTLHPASAAAEGGMPAAGDGTATSSSSSSSGRSRKRDAPTRDSDSGGDPSSCLPASSQGRRRGRAAIEARPTFSPAATAAATSSASIPRRPPLSRPPRGGNGSRGTGFSQEEAVPPLPSTSRSQQQQQQQQGFLADNSSGGKGGDADLEERIRGVIMGYAPLHEDILLLKTVDLSAIHTLIKNAGGVKCTKKDLASYLDARGITFVDRGGVKRRARGGGEREVEGGEEEQQSQQRKRKKKRRPGATGAVAAGQRSGLYITRGGAICR